MTKIQSAGSFAKGFGSEPFYSEEVPEPWIPLKWNNQQRILSCYGREYRIDSLFPASIKSQNNELLAEPIELRILAGSKNLEKTEVSCETVEIKPGLVRIKNCCKIGQNLKSSTLISAEFDGLLRFDVEISANNSAKIDCLDLIIPFVSEIATLFHYYPTQMVWWEPEWDINSGILPQEGLELPFTFHIWIGNDDIGLQWFAESDEGWIPEGRNKVIVIKKKANKTELKINILTETEIESSFRFTFGLIASPVKPFTKKYRTWHYNHQAQWGMEHHRFSSHPLKNGKPAIKDSPSWLDELQKAGARFLGFHEWWSRLQSLARPYFPDSFQSLLESVHEKDMKLIPYTGVYLSELASEYDPSWRIGPPEKMYVYDRGKYETQEPLQRAHIMCCNTPYPNLLIDEFEKLFNEYQIDGIYTDGLAVPLPCTNMEHGCGYFDSDGILRPTAAIFQSREMMKKFHHICQSQNRETLFVSHTSACILLPVLSFSDAYLDGEHLLSKKRAATSELPLEALRAEMCGHNFGIPCYVLPSEDPVYGRDYNRGIALVHDVLMPWNIFDQSDIWKAFDSFGVEGSEWIPYWKSDSILKNAKPEGLLISAYAKQNQGLLLVCFNSNETKSRAEINIDEAKLGLRDGFTVRDAVTDEGLSLSDGWISFGIKPGSFRLVAAENIN